MKESPGWLNALIVAARSEGGVRGNCHLRLGLTCGADSYVLDLERGMLIEHPFDPDCSMAATHETWERIVAGSMTPQRARVEGLLKVQGQAEALLKCSFLFDAAARASKIERSQGKGESN